MARLSGRTAIVTGGAKGIGRHYSQALAAAGQVDRPALGVMQPKIRRGRPHIGDADRAAVARDQQERRDARPEHHERGEDPEPSTSAGRSPQGITVRFRHSIVPGVRESTVSRSRALTGDVLEI